MRGELRSWRKVHLNETHYYAGRIFFDLMGKKKDGTPLATAMVLEEIDRGTYLLVKTVIGVEYVLYKNTEWKE